MQPTWLLLLTSMLLFSSHHTSFTSTHAQIPPTTFTPTTVSKSQSVFIERQKLFIHGGNEHPSSPSPSNQTFYIDLSKPWTTSSPIYGKLADGPAAMGSATALNANKSFWYSIFGGVYRFNIPLGVWETLPSAERKADLPAFIIPSRNYLILINGYADGITYGTRRYDTTATLSSGWSNIPYVVPQQAGEGVTATWNTLKNVAFVFGGISSSKDAGVVALKTLYIWGNTTAASVTGEHPTARYSHCMVEAYDGAKMILFGGYEGANPLDDIYILDVESMKWTKGTPGGPTVARGSASCAVTNDLFVAWGGSTRLSVVLELTTVVRNVAIVYNLKTHQWQDTYSPDPYVLPPTVTAPSNSGTKTGDGSTPTGTGAGTGPGETSGSNSSIGWIIGGAVGGGLAVVGNVVALLFFFRRRRRQANKDNFRPNVVKRSPHTDPDALATSDVIGRQVTKDSFRPCVIKGSPHTDPDALPTSDVIGRQVTKDSFRLSVVKGSPHTDPDALPTNDVTGRQAIKDNFYHNIVKGSPHTDPDAPPTSNVAGSTVLPRYNRSGNNPAGRYQSMTRNPHVSVDAQVLERHPHTTSKLEYIK